MNGISLFTLIIMILWTFFMIWVAVAGGINGIVVYIFFGLPTTLVGWFLWWTLHPEEKPARTPQHKSIPPTSHGLIGDAHTIIGQVRQGLLQAQSQSSKPPKVKKKKNVMHYLRCGGDCGLEEFLENKADGRQNCKNCGWIKR